jgi:transcription antitermination factor NusG
MELNQETWKVIYCSSRQEKKVKIYLEQRGVIHYLPLFNSYVFVKPTEIQRDLVLQVPGVVKYLRYNGKDAEVPEKDVELIQRLIEKGYQIQQHDMSARLEAGDLAEVLDGPFKGQEVVVHYTEDEAFVIVSIEGLSSSIKVNLPREVLKLNKKRNQRDKALW